MKVRGCFFYFQKNMAFFTVGWIFFYFYPHNSTQFEKEGEHKV